MRWKLLWNRFWGRFWHKRNRRGRRSCLGLCWAGFDMLWQQWNLASFGNTAHLCHENDVLWQTQFNCTCTSRWFMFYTCMTYWIILTYPYININNVKYMCSIIPWISMNQVFWNTKPSRGSLPVLLCSHGSSCAGKGQGRRLRRQLRSFG